MTLIQGTLTSGSTTASFDSRPIASAIVSPNASGPIWPGSAVQRFPPPGSVAAELGSALMLATSIATLSGFTVFEESAALMSGLGSEVPMAWPSGSPTAQGFSSINFVSLGSRQQLVVRAERSFARSLKNAPSNVAVGRDFTRQRLIPASTGNVLPVTVVGVVLGSARVIVAGLLGGVKWKYPANAAVILI